MRSWLETIIQMDICMLSRFVSGHSVCWRFGVWDPDGFESCLQQRKTTCILSIRISLACARASKLTTTSMYVRTYGWALTNALSPSDFIGGDYYHILADIISHICLHQLTSDNKGNALRISQHQTIYNIHQYHHGKTAYVYPQVICLLGSGRYHDMTHQYISAKDR